MKQVERQLTPLNRSVYPKQIIAFDTETIADPDFKSDTSNRQILNFGYTISCNLNSGERSTKRYFRFTKPSEFWDYIYNQLTLDYITYAFAHNINFDFTVLDGWNQIEERGWKINFAVFESHPWICYLETDKGKLNLIDTFNYWATSLEKIGESLGLPKLDMPNSEATEEEWNNYCKNDVEIVFSAVQELISYLKVNNLGSLAPTLAGLSMGAFRTRFLNKAITLHDRAKPLSLEESSYHGGIVRNWFIGKKDTGLYYQLDVNSLYPYIMRSSLPCKLLTSKPNQSVKELNAGLDNGTVIARVRIEDYKNTYPYYDGTRFMEAIGRMELSLGGSELRYAIDNGAVKFCSYANYYDVYPILRDFVDYFWSQRKLAKERGDKIGDTFAKLILNSLYGKFVTRDKQFIPWDVSLLWGLYEDYGMTIPEIYLDPSFTPMVTSPYTLFKPIGLREHIKLRYFNSRLEVEEIRGFKSYTSIAIASIITANARAYMRMLYSIAGENNMYYSDTDSLICNHIGYRNLLARGYIDGDKIGKLKVEGVTSSLHLRGPKDYRFDDKDKIKGVSKRARKLSEDTFEQEQFEGVKSVMKRGGKPYIEVKTIRKTLSREYTKGLVSPNGVVKPLIITEW